MTSPSNAGGAGSIPGRGAKFPHASWPKKQNVKQKQYCNKFNKDFKNGPHQKKKNPLRTYSWLSIVAVSHPGIQLTPDCVVLELTFSGKKSAHVDPCS